MPFGPPLGDTPLDKEAAADTDEQPPFDLHGLMAPHYGEHSAENQIRFYAGAMPGAAVVGLIGGSRSEGRSTNWWADCRTGPGEKNNGNYSSDMLHDPDYRLVSRDDQASLTYVAAHENRGMF